MRMNIMMLATLLSISGCVVIPEVVKEAKYSCELSTDKKTLRIVNLTDGDTSFYSWNDEFAALITFPTTAIISASYVEVNNIYHIGEKKIKCN